MSSSSFDAITTIIVNAELVLHYRLRVISKTDLKRIARYRPIFNALAYGDLNSNLQRRLQHQRDIFYANFDYIFWFIKLALQQLLPITLNSAANTDVCTSKTFILQFSRKWLLAVVFLPEDIALRHIRYQARATDLTAFREIAHNLLTGWFQLNETLQKSLVNVNRKNLETLADIDVPLSLTAIVNLISETYPAIKFACDIVTLEGCCNLFPGYQLPPSQCLQEEDEQNKQTTIETTTAASVITKVAPKTTLNQQPQQQQQKI